MKTSKHATLSHLLRRLSFALLAIASIGIAQAQQTALSDIPVLSATNVPATLMLALSVEFPTGNVAAYTDKSGNVLAYPGGSYICPGLDGYGNGVCYFPAMQYLGYFDPAKCYSYSTTANYFSPVGSAPCVNSWSGNMLNWATMSALDEFRKALTGGYRVTDTALLTVLQRARRTSQGSTGNFPQKRLSSSSITVANPASGSTNPIPATSLSGVLPTSQFASGATNFYFRVLDTSSNELTSGSDRGVFLLVSDNSSFTNLPPTKYSMQLYARVKVCDPVAGLESNCNSAHATTDYPNAGKYNKPEGLIQQYYKRIRVGATGYLVSWGAGHPNGIVRALARDNGPDMYVGAGARPANPNAEWDGSTGIFTKNPDPDEVAASIGCGSSGGCVSPSTSGLSGAINYLNQFGLNEPGYETQDTLSELYWATLAYFKNVPLDASYTADNGQIQLDGFPAIANPAASFAGVSGGDPIQYSCQGNSIVTIGDAHTWCDSRVPGSNVDSGALSTSCSNQAPLPALAASGTIPAGGTALDNQDPGANAGAYAKALGNLPLIEANGASPASNTFSGYSGKPDISVIQELNTPPGATYNMAGLAYYAHTHDIRGDNANPGAGDPTVGKQTIDTYTVDVREPGSYDGSVGAETYLPTSLGSNRGPNMYWLAAKYGGFDVDDDQCANPPPAPLGQCVNVNGVPTPAPETYLSWHTNNSSGTNLRPDNYFSANRPDLIQTGLSQIFSNIGSRKVLSAAPPNVSSGRSLAVTNPSVYNTSLLGAANPANFQTYVTTYKPVDWTGDVVGQIFTAVVGSDIIPVAGAKWSAQAQLDHLARGIPPVPPSTTPVSPVAWSTGRRIVTWNGTKGVPFRFGNLSISEQTSLPLDTSASSPLLNYLRGDQSNEGSLYRSRKHVLGDIVDSSARLVQGPLPPFYSDATNPGYSTFATSVTNRAPVVYVGANDGMLHAFAADFSTPTSTSPLAGGGNELFAYVPSFVLAGPSTPSTPLIDGLAATANLSGISTNNYAHHFYVNQTPQVADVDFDFTCNTPGAACTAGTVPNWQTILVGALGKGGRGIYALNITTVPPTVDSTSSAAQEATISKQVMWEFTDPDMGFTFGTPTINKTAKYGWVVLVTSGYNNSGLGQDGHGKLYVLNAQTGKLLETIDTGVGSPAKPSGLGRPQPYIQNLTDGTVESVYVGDLLGNVWRFNLSGTGAYPAPVLLAQLTDPNGNPQPITTTPRVEDDIDSTGLGTRRWVFVGTGQFLDVSDIGNTQQQTMYALRDGTATTPNPSTGGPFTLPLTRSALTAQTNLLNSLALSDGATGWYYDLTLTANGDGTGATERIIVDPDAFAGFNVIAWTTLVPTKDPCQFQGAIYAANFGTGQTALLDAGGAALGSVKLATPVTGIQLVQTNGDPSQIAIIGTPASGVSHLYRVNQNSGTPPLGRTNWRDVLN